MFELIFNLKIKVMIELLKKHWITSLGIVFLFVSFTYFLKLVFDNGWFPPEIRVLTGFILGICVLYSGYHYFRKGHYTTCEILSGIGISLIYTTFTYVAFSDTVNWPYNITFISVLSITGVVAYLSYRYNLRALIFISMLGGLVAPVFMHATPDQDWLLFTYVLILNVASLYVSISRKWQELRVLSFFGTLLIYITYYIYFDPVSWGRPFFYAVALFVTYMGGMIFASWKENDKFTGLNLFISTINAVVFIFWSVFILGSFSISFTIPLIMVGFSFMISSVFIYQLSNKEAFPGIIYVLMGIVLFAIAAANISPMEVPGMEYVVRTLLWFMLVLCSHFIGRFLDVKALRNVGLIGWGILLLYWFTVAWEVEWIRLFGVAFVPFLNAGAITWMILAVYGFWMSHKTEKNEVFLSTALALVSNVIVGGLFTIQIRNLWMAYDIQLIKAGLAISISYLIYALLLFLWGAHTKAFIYRTFGSAVIAITSVKVFFFDLSGEATPHKMVFLMIIGIITLGIGYVNKRWQEKETVLQELNLGYTPEGE
jgi:uncharacterized membrane protein